MAEKLNPLFNIPIEELEERIKTTLNGNARQYNRVIPPQYLSKVDDISILRDETVEALIRHITLRGQEVYPYEDSEIRIYRTEPHGFDIGQTFILEDKLLNIMQRLEGKLLTGFSTRGISKLPPLKFYGETQEKQKAIALYLPPFIEHHQQDTALIDGIHRSYLCASAGTTINAIHIYAPSSQLPFSPITWTNTQLVSEKPAKDRRYVNLDTSLFRDLGKVGIDG